MTEKESKLEVLNKVAESKVFQSSKTTKTLFCFLVEASINNREVKEFTIGRLERLLKDNYLTFNLVRNNISVTGTANDSTRTLKLLGTPDSEHSDFCFFRKLPGPRNNTIILFVSFFDTGMRAAMNFISDPNEVKGLEQVFVRQFGHVPKYIDVLFKVSGYSRTVFKIGVEHLHEINPQKPQGWE